MKMRKFAALMLTLCMMLSLSISAFAASDTIASGTIPDSKIKWELDSHGWLTISGSGEAPVFQSADDQPWGEYREQITEVWYDDMSTLTISDLAYWFEGCTARPLLKTVVRDGKPVGERPDLSAIRSFVRGQLEGEIWPEEQRFENPHRHYIDMSPAYFDLKMRVLRAHG